VMLAFGIFGAAMFAEPAVAEIEEVIGLIQVKRTSVGCRSFKNRHRDHVKAGCYWRLTAPRLASGPCVSRTGTVICLPFLTIPT